MKQRIFKVDRVSMAMALESYYRTALTYRLSILLCVVAVLG